MAKTKQTIAAMIATLVMSITLGAVLNEARAEENTSFSSGEKTISVSGLASMSVKPDLLTVIFGIETQEKTAKNALASNSEMMNKVISALKTAGITPKEISTSSLNIYPVYESYKDELDVYRSKLVGYKVSNIISVETKNLNLAAVIIDGAVSAGVNRVDSVYFSLSPENHLAMQDKLLGIAVINAREKAQNALAPLDYKIIGVKSVSLSEIGIPYPQPLFMGDFPMAESTMKTTSPTSVFSSEQDISTSAHVVFLIGSN